MFKAVFSDQNAAFNTKFSEPEAMSAQFGEIIRVANLIHIDSTENWNAQLSLIAQSGHVYVYSDYTTLNNENIPGIKIGDGTSYLIDLPFVAGNTQVSNGRVLIDTKSNWDSQTTLISQTGTLYVYSDYITVFGTSVPGMKIGDGMSYLIDLPFFAGDNTELTAHINNTNIHITEEERLFWNEKVRCFLSQDDNESIVFTTQ